MGSPHPEAGPASANLGYKDGLGFRVQGVQIVLINSQSSFRRHCSYGGFHLGILTLSTDISLCLGLLISYMGHTNRNHITALLILLASTEALPYVI